MDEDRIQILLLGPPQFIYHGQQLVIKRRALRRLFSFLACQNRPINRVEICEMFWPADEEAIARKNLREAVSLLRAELPCADVVLVQNDFLLLNPEKIWVDVQKFEKLAEKLRQNTELVNNARLPEKEYGNVREALRMWRSSEFLDGINLLDSSQYQYWVTQKRESLFYWRQLMMEWLANHYITIGNLNEALYWLSTALLRDRQNTELNYLTLNCLKDLGYRAAALNYCNLLEGIYSRGEITTIPGVLKQLIHRVRTEVDFHEERKIIHWDLYDHQTTEFIGREAILTTATQWINRGGIFLLTGEPESGKTRLLKELYSSLEISPRFVYFRVKREDQSIPYQVFTQIIREIMTEKDWRQLEYVYAQALFQLFPELCKVREDINDQDLERSLGLKRLLPEAFGRLIEIILGEKRGLLMIDDAHWCDEETMLLFGYLFEQKATKPMGTCILTSRNDLKNESLLSFFRDKKLKQKFDTLEIEPFNFEQTSFLLRSIDETQWSADAIKWLLDGSGGNIGYMLDILNTIEQSGADLNHLSKLPNWPISEGLRARISDRLSRLDGIATEILSILAVGWKPVNTEVFAQLPLDSLIRLNNKMSELMKARLIELRKDEENITRYHFTHGVVKQIFLERMDNTLRKTIIEQYFSKLQ